MQKKLFKIKKIAVIGCALIIGLTTCIAVAAANTNGSENDIQAKIESPHQRNIDTLANKANIIVFGDEPQQSNDGGKTWQPWQLDGNDVLKSHSDTEPYTISEFEKMISELKANAQILINAGFFYSQEEFDRLIAGMEEQLAASLSDGSTEVVWHFNSGNTPKAVRVSNINKNADGTFNLNDVIVEDFNTDGINSDELNSRLIDRNETKEEVLASLKARLTEEVEAGRMSQEQADKQFEIQSRFLTSNNTVTTDILSAVIAKQYANRFDKYEEYGLTYDKDTDSLYFNGELVRYFEDFVPVDVGENNNACTGIDYFNENGTIDVHAVRDLSTKAISNDDDSYDVYELGRKLVGVEPYSQAEFDARDIDKIKNPPQMAVTVNNSVEVQSDAPQFFRTTKFTLSDESKEAFNKLYAEFGLTYDDGDVFRYDGKTVRRFCDEQGAYEFVMEVANDYEISVDLTAVRDAGGKLTGMLAAGKEEFDERTTKIEKSQKEWKEFVKNNPNVTCYSVNTDAGDNSNQSGASENNSIVTNINADVASYSKFDFAVEKTLESYFEYGVSYDKTGKAWVFNGKSIDFLIDVGHQIYVNFKADNTDIDFAETVKSSKGAYLRVVRKAGGEIDKIIEMTVDEAVKTINDVFN